MREYLFLGGPLHNQKKALVYCSSVLIVPQFGGPRIYYHRQTFVAPSATAEYDDLEGQEFDIFVLNNQSLAHLAPAQIMGMLRHHQLA